MKSIALSCAWCGNQFLKPSREHKYHLGLGRALFFCSISCGTQFNNQQRSTSNKTIELTCCECGSPFLKEKREYNRQVKVGRTQFLCSRACVGTHTNKTRSAYNTSKLWVGSQPDEFTQFRWFLLRARQHAKHDPTDVDLPYLRGLWVSQDGTCPFTGWRMLLPATSEGFTSSAPNNASLDRIDGTRGYVRGNVRFVCLMANLARQKFTDNQLRQFCSAVFNYGEMKWRAAGRLLELSEDQ